jgi:antitoxin component YwqK of YwqJK toxin-antitoxin module
MKEVKPLVVDETLQTKKFTSPDGTVRYIKDGKLHNWEGPALITPEGKEEYYINGTQHTKDSYKKAKKDGVGLPWYKSGVAKQRF